jgi:hypothetical protein
LCVCEAAAEDQDGGECDACEFVGCFFWNVGDIPQRNTGSLQFPSEGAIKEGGIKLGGLCNP